MSQHWLFDNLAWLLWKIPIISAGFLLLVSPFLHYMKPLYTNTIFTQCLVYLATKAFYNAYLHPLSKFPGPKLYAASHIPIALHMIKGRYNYRVKDLHDIYGPVVRVAPNELAFSDGEAFRSITTKPGLPKSPQWYIQIPGRTSIVAVGDLSCYELAT